MVDHVSIPVADIDRAARFYDVVLATLGYVRRKERPGAIGYGPPARPAPRAAARARRVHHGQGNATSLFASSVEIVLAARPSIAAPLRQDGQIPAPTSLSRSALNLASAPFPADETSSQSSSAKSTP